MGMVALCAGLIAAFVALVPGIIAVVVHHRARKEGRGSWPIFIALTIFGALACFGVAWALMQAFAGGTGAPTGEQYTALLISAAVCFAGPGFGLSLGAFALLKRVAAAPDSPQ